jgi:adenylate kinase family enzyme
MQNDASPYKDFIRESMERSVIIPAQLMTQLLKTKMIEAQMKGKDIFLLPGFPRSLDQVNDFKLKVGTFYQYPLLGLTSELDLL